ncbi:MAG: CarD family transcriptional regulator [Alphaproteobacteria bacterium]|nr:CarD family transcriptional regulator [Alphaproteobacteria bacterium]
MANKEKTQKPVSKATKAVKTKTQPAKSSKVTTKTVSKTLKTKEVSKKVAVAAKAPAKPVKKAAPAVAKLAATKSVAKTKVVKKAPMKPIAKPVAKVMTKAAAKPVAKKQVTKTAVKAPVKPAAKPVAKKAAVKPAVKPVKAVAPKAPVKKVETKIAAVAKPAAKLVAAKGPAKVTPKLVTPPVEKPRSATLAPVTIKAPENQNAPVALKKPAEGLRPVPAPIAVDRPVYRPIQVIHKPLAPLTPVRQMAPIAPNAEKVEYKKGDYVVYPAHGVGQIEAVETQIIAGMEIKLYAICFEKDRMRLKVPVFKAHASGLRRLSTSNRMQDALKTLQGRAQIRRAMWSRRAQEYETKINSGDPIAIAEVLRDLKRSNDETEQSYSERQIYQSALERLAREVAALEKITEIEAAERLENMIKGRRARASADKGDDKDIAVVA